VLGVPLKPPIMAGFLLPNGAQGPLGYKAWLQQWVTNEWQRNAAMYFDDDNYRAIQLLPGYAGSPEEQAEVDALITRMRAATGHPVPQDIDDAFRRLAERKAQSRSTTQTAIFRMRQALALWREWLLPLPPELAPTPRVELPADVRQWPAYVGQWAANSVHGNSWQRVDAATRLWRSCLGAVFLLICAIMIALRWPPMHVLALGTLALIAAKSVLVVTSFSLELRYTVTVAPFMELVSLLGVHALWAGRARYPWLPRTASGRQCRTAADA
jgi:hypothetical protein